MPACWTISAAVLVVGVSKLTMIEEPKPSVIRDGFIELVHHSCPLHFRKDCRPNEGRIVLKMTDGF